MASNYSWHYHYENMHRDYIIVRGQSVTFYQQFSDSLDIAITSDVAHIIDMIRSGYPVISKDNSLAMEMSDITE